ncbi:helix-turn-helix domain-containing protein [Noviherbaspirillum pedocola]|uniref:Helix-turn-helix domain-containing protein n=1 Tax=Noviherbaspirillum pedocola TaxID=2801341 RepID=A0A934W9E1_9BURK|nr:hypothetical protein [Noviherbaspirillum pedocola]MBK4738760.1 hypothetical protein [Noviherbaspirillum pedocola]
MTIRTAADVLARRLPRPIQAAQYRLSMHHSSWDLPIRVLRLGQIFISHTPLDKLDQPVICSRQKAAEMLGTSERSITRYATQLERRGLIRRIKQTYKHESGTWDCMRFVWTEGAKTLFDAKRKGQAALDMDAQQAASPAPLSAPQATFETARESFTSPDTSTTLTVESQPEKIPVPMADRGTNLAHKSGAFCKQKLSIENKPERESLQNSPKRSSRMPDDLVEPAKTLQLQRSQICYLFKICKDVGQRLQDALRFCLPGMVKRGIKGRDAVAWLKTALQSGRDFRWAVRQEEHLEIAQQANAERQAKVNSITVALRRPHVRLPSGLVIKEVTGNVVSFIDPSTGRSAGTHSLSHLAVSLLDNAPDWVSRLLSGVNDLQEAHTPAGRAVTPPVPPAAVSDVARDALAGLREMMKRNRVFA